MSLNLTIAHNVFLSRSQRYDLFNGKEIEVVGISTPVWNYNGITSEPAHEVYCKYKLIPTEYKMIVKYTESGYHMLLPHKEFNPEDNIKNPLSLKNILDIKDGGIEWIAFRQFGKIKRKNKKTINMVHFVEIKPLEDLIDSLL